MGSDSQSSGVGGTSSTGGNTSGGYDGGYDSSSYGGDIGGYNSGNNYGGYGGYGQSGDEAEAEAMDAARQALRQSEIKARNELGRTLAEQHPDVYSAVQKMARVSGLAAAIGWGMEQHPDEFGASLAAAGLTADSIGFGGDGGGATGTGGSTSQNGGTSAAPVDPLADVFAHFTAATTQDFKAPEYESDPTGMVAGGMKSMTDYQRDYAPYAAKMRAEVDRIGTPEYLQQQRGMAMADVQSQYDRTMQQNQRGMQRMGVNPNSGRMLAMQNQGAIQNAASKVGAAAKAEGLVKTNYLAGLGAVNTMGTDFAKMGQGWASLGNDAAKTKSLSNLSSSELGLKAQTQTQTNDFNWGKLAVDRYGIDMGVQNNTANNNARADAQDSSNMWGLAGIGLSALF